MKGLKTIRQEMVGDYELGGVLLTHVLPDDEEEVNINKFVLEYIDSEDDQAGVVANACFAEALFA